MASSTPVKAQRYVIKPQYVYAMQWDGTYDSATAIINWMTSNGGQATYVNDPIALSIATPQGIVPVSSGDYIVNNESTKNFNKMSNGVFNSTYAKSS